MSKGRIPLIWVNNAASGWLPIFEGGRAYCKATDKVVTVRRSIASPESVEFIGPDGYRVRLIARGTHCPQLYTEVVPK